MHIGVPYYGIPIKKGEKMEKKRQRVYLTDSIDELIYVELLCTVRYAIGNRTAGICI